MTVRRSALGLSLGLAACGVDVPRVGEPLPDPDAFACENTPTADCVERPAIALANARADASEPAALYVAAGAGELFRIDPGRAGIDAQRLGYVGHDPFRDLDRLLSCDLNGDGRHEIVFSTIDALDPGYVVWGDPGTNDVFGKRTAPKRLQSARCVDVDGDGYDDLVGLVAADRIGVLGGQSWGLADGLLEIPVPPVDPLGSEPEYAWLLVTATSGDLDDDGSFEWIWTIRERAEVRIWSLDAASESASERPGPSLGDVEIQRLELADVDGDEALDLVVLARGPSGDGRLLVGLGDAAAGFADPIEIAFGDVPRRVSFADFDADGDREALVVGGWNDGVAVVDLVDSELEIAQTFPVVANDAVALDFDVDDRWDLAILLADTWRVEVVASAFGGLAAPARRD